MNWGNLSMPKTADHNADTYHYFNNFTVGQVIGGLRARFPASYRFTKEYEGGYVNDPNDPGGCTNMGITIGTLQAWRGEAYEVTCEDVKNLEEPEVGLIYATNYWAPVWGNQLPVGLNTQVWDFGVNAGPSRAVKYLQILVGSAQDGIMGPNTLDATIAYCNTHGMEEVLEAYSSLRQQYYESLSNFSIYGDGWTNRNNACRDFSIELSQQKIPSFPTPPSGETAALRVRIENLEKWAKELAYKMPS
jgi:lysozyme family protein